MSYLRVENLKKSYTESVAPIEVLANLSLTMDEGQTLAVVGQSGVGKSTLLHCLGLLDRVDEGRIFYGPDCVSDGRVIALGSKDVIERRQKVGFVFQFHYLMSELTAEENVMIPLLLQQKEPEAARSQARNMLSLVGLGHRFEHRPAQLSGGEQQRVAIARALVHRPKIILADEPTGNLDPKTAEQVFNVLKDLSLSLKAILVMATHNLELARFLDRRATLLEGRLHE